jgi:lambda family phage portal protein
MYENKRLPIILPITASGYSEAGASFEKRALKAFDAISSSANQDINYNNARIRNRTRILYMSSSIAASAINTNRTHIVGPGLKLKSSVKSALLKLTPETAKEWQSRTQLEFELWASKKENCDAIGINNFAALQQLALKSWLLSGDVFVLIKRHKPTPQNPYTLRLHVIEADRVCTPSIGVNIASLNGATDGKNKDNGNLIYDGVEVDNGGRVVAYHICNTYPNQIVTPKAEWTRVEAYGAKTNLPNILQIMESERPEQYRGVSILAPVIEMLLQMRRYTESELVSAVIQSFFTAVIMTDQNPGDIPINEVGGGDVMGVGENTERSVKRQVSHNPNEYEMGPGTMVHLKPGEKVQFGSPNIPTAGFVNFEKEISKQIGAALELPHDVLVKEFDKSYSAARGALMEAWEAFTMRRSWFCDTFCQPIYELWLSEAVALGRIKAPGFFDDPLVHAAWSAANWIGPTATQLDPVKEAKAAVINVDRGFKTYEQVTTENGGGDWSENITQVKREIAALKDAGGGTYMATLSDGEGENGQE